MTLTELPVDQLSIICYIDTQTHNIESLYKLMSMGITAGLEIRKLSQISTCAEYRCEGMSPKIIIDNCLSDYIIVEKLDDID